ncbi:MAG: hypothetical protein ACR2GH_02365 [Pseudonocardia sp.]
MNPQTEPASSELEAMISRAIRTLNEHTNHADLCAVCGCAMSRPHSWV